MVVEMQGTYVRILTPVERQPVQLFLCLNRPEPALQVPLDSRPGAGAHERRQSARPDDILKGQYSLLAVHAFEEIGRPTRVEKRSLWWGDQKCIFAQGFEHRHWGQLRCLFQ